MSGNVFSAVSSAVELSADIRTIDLASQATGGDGTNYVITLKAGATLTEAADLFAVNLRGNDTLTIDGQGATLDGNLAHRGLFVYSGHVTVQNLTIANAVARGGNGAYGGGGGGAGLGGGLFVASDTAHGALASQVTLNNVVFLNNAAIGGNGGLATDGTFYVGGGGGGGLGGDGASAGPFGGGSASTYPGGQGGGGGGGGVGEGGFGAGAAGGKGGDSQTNTSHALPGGGGFAGANGLIPGATPGLFGFSGASLTLRDSANHTYVATGGPGGAMGNDGGGGGGGGGGAGGGAPASGGPAWGGAGGGGGGGGVQGGGHAGYGADGGIGGFGGGGGGGVDFVNYIAPSGSDRGSGNGGNGGFGGGGGGEGAGGTGFVTASGIGGWGGGGGGGPHGEAGGFGGGVGGQTGGGGGLGAGGGIFVQQGASITISGGSMSGGSVGKGTGIPGLGSTSGKAFGAGIFLQGNQTLVFAPAAGQKTVISDVITDEAGSGGGGVGATGKGSLTLDGPGTLQLTAANTFSGGVTIKQGTLEVGDTSGARGNIAFAANGGGTLKVDAGVTSLNAQVIAFDSSSSFDFAGFDATKTSATFVNSFGPALRVTDGVKTDVVFFANSLDLTGHPFYVVDDGAGGSIVSLRTQPYTSVVYTYDSHGAVVAARFNGVTGQAYSSFEYDYSGGALTGQKYFFTNIAGQPYTAYEEDLDVNGRLTKFLFTGVGGQAYSSYEYDYDGGVFAGSKYFFTGVSGQPYTGYEMDLDVNGRLAKFLFTGVSGQAYSSYEYDYAGGVLTGSKYFFTGIGGQAYTGYEQDLDSSGRLDRFAFTGVTGQAYSSYAYDYQGGVLRGSNYFFTDVSGQAFTGYEQDLDTAGRLMRFAATGVAGQGYSSYEYDYTGGVLTGSRYFTTNIAGKPYTGVEQDLDTTGMLTRLAFTGVSGQAYSSYEYDYKAGVLSGSKYFTTNVAGQPHTGVEQDLDSQGHLTRLGFSGVVGQPYTAYEYDYANGVLAGSKYFYTNVSNQAYASYETDLDANGAVSAQILDNNDGTHRIVGFQDNLTFNSRFNDITTGGGSNQTFVYSAHFGVATVTDFAAHTTGAGHNSFVMPTSEFADFATLLAHTQTIDGNAVITAGNGDQLTLVGVTKTMLATLGADFSFA